MHVSLRKNTSSPSNSGHCEANKETSWVATAPGGEAPAILNDGALLVSVWSGLCGVSQDLQCLHFFATARISPPHRGQLFVAGSGVVGRAGGMRTTCPHFGHLALFPDAASGAESTALQPGHATRNAIAVSPWSWHAALAPRQEKAASPARPGSRLDSAWSRAITTSSIDNTRTASRCCSPCSRLPGRRTPVL